MGALDKYIRTESERTQLEQEEWRIRLACQLARMMAVQEWEREDVAEYSGKTIDEINQILNGDGTIEVSCDLVAFGYGFNKCDSWMKLAIQAAKLFGTCPLRTDGSSFVATFDPEHPTFAD